MLKVGDKVIMSEEGRREYSNTHNNPHRSEGKVEGIRDEYYCYSVTWDNGGCNFYRAIDLDLVLITDWLKVKSQPLIYNKELYKTLNINGK